MADNNSDAYKKALKQIQDMLDKQKALQKSTDGLKGAWNAVSSEIFKLSGAEFFDKVERSPEDMRKMLKEVSDMKSQFDLMSDAAAKALDQNKSLSQFDKSLKNILTNGQKEALKYSSTFNSGLKTTLSEIRNQNSELSKIIQSEKDIKDVISGKIKLNAEQEKQFAKAKVWYESQQEFLDTREVTEKRINDLVEDLKVKHKELGGLNDDMLQKIVQMKIDNKSNKEIIDSMNASERQLLGSALELGDEFNDQVKAMGDLEKAIQETSKSAGEMKEKFNFAKGLRESALSLKTDFIKNITKFDDVLHDVQKNTGIMMDSFSNAKAFGDLTTKASQFGVSVEQAGEMMTNLSKELNTTNFGVLAKASEDFLAIEGATGAASSDITTIAGEMMRMGATSEQVKETFQETTNIAQKFGVSSKKVIDSIAKNITKFKNMGFQGGEKSLARLAAKAESMRMSIDSAFDMSEKARSIEGAMDMAAELQLAGGSFSNINPMDLLAAARKGPEEMQKILSSMGKDIGKFNAEGKFEIDAVDTDRLRMVADATGAKFEDLRNGIEKTAEDAAKLNPFQGMIDGIDAADQDLAKSALGDMIKRNADGTLTINAESDMAKKMGVNKLEDVNSDTIAAMVQNKKADEKTLEEQNKRNQSLSKSWDNFINGLMSLGSILQPILEGLTWFIQSITSIFQEISSWGDGFGRYILGGLMAAFLLFGTSVGTFVTQGIASFSKSVMRFGKAIMNPKAALGGLMGKKGGGANPMSDIAGDKNMTPAAGQAKKGFLMGLADGIRQFGKVKMGDLLKFAASLVIIGGAIIGFGVAMAAVGGEAGIGQMVTAAVSLGLLMGSIWVLSKIAGKVDMSGVLKGSLAMLLVGASIIPFAYAAQMLTGIDWMSVLAGIGILTLVVFGLMGLGMLMAGPILFLLAGVGILIAVGAALAIAADGLLLSAVAFQQLGAIDWGAFSEMGAALMSVVPGMLGFSLAAMAFANPISLLGLMFMAMALGGLVMVMAPLAESLTLGADSLDRFAEGLEKLSAAADKLSLEKLEKLKELSESMANASAGGAIASAMANMANAVSGGGNGGNKENNEPRKLEIAIKLNGRDVNATIIKDSAILK